MDKYKYIIVPLFTLILCQILKFIIEGIKSKEFSIKRLFSGSGGMPSSHTSLSVSLLMIIALNEGVDNIYFAIMLVLSMIVAYDGMNVRLETGKQAKTINALVDAIFDKSEFEALKEELGHKPKEVLFGIILGVIVPIIYTYVIL
ncbi:MAG: divergent PAP2 family protein [Bacilli bacterium]|nr:divergent PAP2 family protein [Bacilli bacterium]